MGGEGSRKIRKGVPVLISHIMTLESELVDMAIAPSGWPWETQSWVMAAR
jgi:hypothetical protein